MKITVVGKLKIATIHVTASLLADQSDIMQRLKYFAPDNGN
jgi:hypothetical protein